METFSLENISLFICFFLPGFIAVKTFHLLAPSDKIDVTNSVLEIIGFSCLNLFIFSPIFLYFGIRYDWIYKLNLLFFISMIFVVFVGPILLAISFFKLSNSNYFNKYAINRSGTPWDEFFMKKKYAYLVIVFNDQSKIGGFYGENSAASVYPKANQIYIEQVWIIDEKNKFLKQKPRTFGAIIDIKDIKYIEFYKNN